MVPLLVPNPNGVLPPQGGYPGMVYPPMLGPDGQPLPQPQAYPQM
jgi:hypothetical protein